MESSRERDAARPEVLFVKAGEQNLEHNQESGGHLTKG